jgi:hypothetical protein
MLLDTAWLEHLLMCLCAGCSISKRVLRLTDTYIQSGRGLEGRSARLYISQTFNACSNAIKTETSSPKVDASHFSPGHWYICTRISCFLFTLVPLPKKNVHTLLGHGPCAFVEQHATALRPNLVWPKRESGAGEAPAERLLITVPPHRRPSPSRSPPFPER